LGEFLVFVLIILGAGWGSAFLMPVLRQRYKKLDQSMDHEVLARVLEDVDQLSTRLTQVEEELDFFKDLNAPQEHDRLPSPSEGGDQL